MSMNAKTKELYLAHFGILGQKWGVRRYQNEDGTLTEEGRQRYLKEAATKASGYALSYKNSKTQIDDLKKNGWKAKSVFDDDELGDVIESEYGKKKADEVLFATISEIEKQANEEKRLGESWMQTFNYLNGTPGTAIKVSELDKILDRLRQYEKDDDD